MKKTAFVNIRNGEQFVYKKNKYMKLDSSRNFDVDDGWGKMVSLIDGYIYDHKLSCEVYKLEEIDSYKDLMEYQQEYIEFLQEENKRLHRRLMKQIEKEVN